MADDAEKIAMVIETQAQLAGLRQASAETSAFAQTVAAGEVPLKDIGDQAAATAEKITISAAQSRAAWAQAGGSVSAYNTIITQMAAAQRAAAATSGAAAVATSEIGVRAQQAASQTRPLNEAQDALSPKLRSSALAASRLTLVLDGMGGGVQGVARSVGTLAYGVSDLGGPKMALLASGAAAAAIVLATLVEVLEKAHDKAVDVDDVFKNHLGNLNLSSAKAEMASLDRQLAELQAKIPDATQKLDELFNPTRPGAHTGNGFLADFWENTRHQLTLTTAEEEQYQRVLKEREELQKRIGEEGVSFAQQERDRVHSSTVTFEAQSAALRGRILGTQAGLNDDSLTQQTSALSAQALAQQQAITQEYYRTHEQIVAGLGLTKLEIAQRDELLKKLYQATSLQDQLLRQQDEQRKAAATSRVVQSGQQAQEDLEGPAARLNAIRIRDEREYTEEVKKEGVARSVARAAQLEKDARAERDYLTTIRDAQTEYYRQLNETIGGDDTRAYLMETAELELSLQEQVTKGLLSQDQVRELLHQRELRREKDRAVLALQQLQSSSQAAESYGGKLGAIGKAVNNAIRAGEIAANAVKDFGRGKSEAAAAIASAASGNFVGAALHGAASVAFFGAAAFEAAEAIGSATGGGGGGGAGGGGTEASTFTPSDQNKSGGQQIIIQTVNPNDRTVISATSYYLNQQQVLKVPALLPPAPAGYAVGRVA